MISADDVCVCGHMLDEHALNGTCEVDDCRCAGFEPGEFE